MKKTSAFLIALLLISCSVIFAAPQKEATAAKKVELRIDWWGSQRRHERTIKVIEMYMEEKPNVTVTHEFAGWTDYWTKLTTKAAGGNLPDVMQHDYARIAEWQSRGLVLSLDEYVKSGVLDFSNVAEGSLAGGRIGGKLYAVNLGTNSQVFLMDVDAFKKAGIALPRQNWTWEEFEQIVLDLHDKLGIWGMGNGLSDNQMWKSLYLSNGHQWSYSDDGKSLGYTDDSLLVEYFKMIMRLQEADAIPTRAEEVADFDGKGVEAEAIVDKRAVIDYHWSNQIVAVWGAAGEERNLKANHLPRLKGGEPSNYPKPSMFWSVTSHSKNPEEAAKFIDYFTNSVDANKVLLGERGIPISSVVRDSLKPLLSKGALEGLEYMGRIEKDSSPIKPPDPPGHANIVNNIWHPEVVDPMRYGKITPEEAVKILRDRASAILAK